MTISCTTKISLILHNGFKIMKYNVQTDRSQLLSKILCPLNRQANKLFMYNSHKILGGRAGHDPMVLGFTINVQSVPIITKVVNNWNIVESGTKHHNL